jgi:hypothetical protein
MPDDRDVRGGHDCLDHQWVNGSCGVCHERKPMCEKCAEALHKLKEVFGEEDAHELLWNATCYPMDGPICLGQTETLIRMHRETGKTAAQLIRDVEDEMYKAMSRHHP